MRQRSCWVGRGDEVRFLRSDRWVPRPASIWPSGAGVFLAPSRRNLWAWQSRPFQSSLLCRGPLALILGIFRRGHGLQIFPLNRFLNPGLHISTFGVDHTLLSTISECMWSRKSRVVMVVFATRTATWVRRGFCRTTPGILFNATFFETAHHFRHIPPLCVPIGYETRVLISIDRLLLYSAFTPCRRPAGSFLATRPGKFAVTTIGTSYAPARLVLYRCCLSQSTAGALPAGFLWFYGM